MLDSSKKGRHSTTVRKCPHETKQKMCMELSGNYMNLNSAVQFVCLFSRSVKSMKNVIALENMPQLHSFA